MAQVAAATSYLGAALAPHGGAPSSADRDAYGDAPSGAEAGAPSDAPAALVAAADQPAAAMLADTPLYGMQDQFSSAMGGMILHLHTQDMAMQARIQQLEQTVEDLQRRQPRKVQ